jgi:hypothetical protein
MTTLPPYRFLQCRFYAPIGVTNVRSDGIGITGDWKQNASRHYGDKSLTLAQRFADSSIDAETILDFTKRWGPLSGNPHDGNDGFRFTVESWKETRKSFAGFWRMVQRHGAAPFEPINPILVEFEKKSVILHCPDICTFMCLEVMSNAKSLRVCEREECNTPYFLAQHGKERYCSTDCANWAQSIWKKRWHEEQRQKRIKEEGKDGTQKTR